MPKSGLKAYLALDNDGRKKIEQPGIPYQDTTNNELKFWLENAVLANPARSAMFAIKGDSKMSYKAFSAIIETLKELRLNSFALITAGEADPTGAGAVKKVD